MDHQIISEELTDAHKRKAEKMAESGHDYYQDQFILNHAAPGTYQKFMYQDNGKKAIRIPIKLNQDNAAPDYQVKDFLDEHGYHIKDTASYRAGLAHKMITTGNPDKGIPYKQKQQAYKIGGLLEKHGAKDHIKNAFERDPVRVGKGQTDFDLVISNHPHDIYGASTGRSWTSCADMDTRGQATGDMKGEINNHTHAAYLVPRGGDIDKDAIGRLLFKHHTAMNVKSDVSSIYNHQTLISEGKVYGTTPTDFRQVAEHEMGKLFPIKNDVYLKNSNVYDDSSAPLHVPSGVDVHPESLDTLWKSAHKDQKERLYKHVVAGAKYRTKKLKEVSTALNDLVNPKLTGDFITDHGNMVSAAYGLEPGQKRHIGYHIGHGGKYREKYESNMDRIMSGFDIDNNDHRFNLRTVSSENPVRYYQYASIEKHIPAVRDVNTFRVANAIHEMIGNRKNEKLNVAPDHELGPDPVRKLAESGVLKTPNDYYKAYATFRDKSSIKENAYSQAHRLDELGMPNAHLYRQQLENELSAHNNKTEFGNRHLALAFYHMSPEARAHYANHLGVDHEKLMHDHQDYINKYTQKD